MQEAREAVAALFGAAANLAERAHPSGPGGATPAQASGAGGAPVGAAADGEQEEDEQEGDGVAENGFIDVGVLATAKAREAASNGDVLGSSDGGADDTAYAAPLLSPHAEPAVPTATAGALERLRQRAAEATRAAEAAWERVPSASSRGRTPAPRPAAAAAASTSPGILGRASLSFEPSFSSEAPPSLDDKALLGIGGDGIGGGGGGSGARLPSEDACPLPGAFGGASAQKDEELPFSRETNDALRRALKSVSGQYPRSS